MYTKKVLIAIGIVLLCMTPIFAGGDAETEGTPSTTTTTTNANASSEVTITFWTTEEQPERMAVQEGIADLFKQKTGITVNVVPVSENLLAERATAAFAAGDLPDVIYHPVKNTWSWAEAGILDADAATEVINELGKATFLSRALDVVEDRSGYVAVPVDGWSQLIVYRKDLFENAGLAVPNTYANILAAIKALHNPPQVYGFVAATDPNQDYTMQVFEHVALANGVQLVDSRGNVVVDSENLVNALNFYKQLAEASPPGNLYWQQSRELFLNGNTAMIIWSPFILDELAGLRDSVPVTVSDDPTSDALANDTAFLGSLAGPDNPSGAGWADFRYFGITVDADTEAAIQFVAFSMDEGYIQTLGVAPEGKFPIRNGTKAEPNKFVDAWAELEVGVDRKAALTKIYPREVISTMRDGLQTGSRWGIETNRMDVMAKVYETKKVSLLIREFLDGKRSAEETSALIAEEIRAYIQ